MKRLLSAALLLIAVVAQAQTPTKIDISQHAKGVLPVANGGLNTNTVPSTDGQVPIWSASLTKYVPGDPIVSLNYTNLINAQAATATVAGSATRLSIFSVTGTLYVTFASITGSGTSCTLQLKNYDSLGNSVNNGSAISVTPANGTTTFAVTSAAGFQNAAQLSSTYACSGYPTAGTISVEFVQRMAVDASGVNVTVNTIPAGTLFGEVAPMTSATTTNSLVGCYLQSAATTNSTNCKASSGNFYGFRAINTTATLYFLRMYNSSSAPTCSSATGFIESIPIPANTSGTGIVAIMPYPVGYGTGISFCFTGGGSSTDNTNAATGVYLAVLYK